MPLEGCLPGSVKLFTAPLAFSSGRQHTATLAVGGLGSAAFGLRRVDTAAVLVALRLVANNRILACLEAAVTTLHMDDHRVRLVLNPLQGLLIERLGVVEVQQRALLSDRGLGGLDGALPASVDDRVLEPGPLRPADRDDRLQLELERWVGRQLNAQHLRQGVFDALVMGAQRLQDVAELAPTLVLVAHRKVLLGVDARRDNHRHDYVPQRLALGSSHRPTNGLHHIDR